MCKLREMIWYIICANRMLLKNWPHLTFKWPFVNISLTIPPTHSKLYIFVILITSRTIWYTWKVIWSILKFWPLLELCVTPTGKGAKSSEILSKYFLTYNDFKSINNSFSSKWHLSTSYTTVFKCCCATLWLGNMSQTYLGDCPLPVQFWILSVWYRFILDLALRSWLFREDRGIKEKSKVRFLALQGSER